MTHQTTILVVDDDPLVLAVIVQTLARAALPSVQVLTACDGAEGLCKALEVQPDFIITDLMMPRMDGYDMVQSLRQTQLNKETRIIGVSCRSTADARTKAFSQLCDNFLVKPFMPNELLEKLDCLA